MGNTLSQPNNLDPTTLSDQKIITGTDLPGDKRGIDVVTRIADDTGNLDAFSRLRTSGTGNRLDVEFIYDKQDNYFDEITNNGTVTHNANTKDLTLSLGDANNGSYATMQSYPVPYTPGNSQLVETTGVMDLAGIGGGTAEVFIRTSISGSAVETTIEQSEWTALNSATDIDWTKSHIFVMDFQSLKVGRIKFGLNVGGAYIQVAQILNDNTRDSGYWQLPNLPVRYKLYTTGGETFMEMGYGDDNNGIGFRYRITANASATMKAICCTVKSEGGADLRDLPGLSSAIDMGVTAATVSTTLIPLISIRPKATFKSVPNLILSIPKLYTILTSRDLRVVVIHDGTLTNESWADVNTTESCIEYDVSATAITGGHVVYNEYVATGAGQTGSSGTGFLGKTSLWNRQSAVTGIYTLAAVRAGANDASVLAGLQWEELR